MVLIAAMRSAPPMALTARSTRLCSRLGVAQETTRIAQSAARACFMGLLPGWMDQPRRTGSRLQLFLLFRRRGGACAGGGAGGLLRRRLRQDGVELGTADAAVAIAVDGDPVAVLRRIGGELFPAQVAVLVAVEALEQRSLRLGAPGEPGAKQQRGGKDEPFEAGQREHPATIAGESGHPVRPGGEPVSAARCRRRVAAPPECAWTAGTAPPTALRCPCGR